MAPPSSSSSPSLFSHLPLLLLGLLLGLLPTYYPSLKLSLSSSSFSHSPWSTSFLKYHHTSPPNPHCDPSDTTTPAHEREHRLAASDGAREKELAREDTRRRIMEERHGERSGEENQLGRKGRSRGIWVRDEGEWVGELVRGQGGSGSGGKKVVVLVRTYSEEEVFTSPTGISLSINFPPSLSSSSISSEDDSETFNSLTTSPLHQLLHTYHPHVSHSPLSLTSVEYLSKVGLSPSSNPSSLSKTEAGNTADSYETIEILLPPVSHLFTSLTPLRGHAQPNNPKQKKGLRKDQIEELYYDLGRLLHSWLEIALANEEEVILITSSQVQSHVGAGGGGRAEKEEEEAKLEEIMQHHTSHPREELLSHYLTSLPVLLPPSRAAHVKERNDDTTESDQVRGWEQVLVLLGYVGELEGERIGPGRAAGGGWKFGV